MPERVHTDNLLWVCCCCGCLPFLALIHGLIAVIPTMVMVVPACTVISVILLPHDIVLTYKSVYGTSVIGPNLKCLAMLTLPIPLLLWPVLVLIGSILVSLLWGLFAPMAFVFDKEYNLLWGPIIATWKYAAKGVKSFWKFNYETYFQSLREFETEELPEAGVPFDISIIQLIVGLFIGIIGAVFVGTFCGILSVLKCIPLTIRGYYEMWKAFFSTNLNEKICLFVPFVIANLLLPLVALLVLAFVVVAGFFVGCAASYSSYKCGFFEGFKWMGTAVIAWDTATNSLMINVESSCFGKYSEDRLRFTLLRA
eukprot:TRINITY_DN4194_c0_g1_i1.p1 TRINITY_DN4194_c0_g1~~TRINITY_DN4194_c0_g1_i1.p1  ORF type:complete len:311 (-),score=28.10 TRINITY_DN4194_c0_g1_i1:108-1040(-)